MKDTTTNYKPEDFPAVDNTQQKGNTQAPTFRDSKGIFSHTGEVPEGKFDYNNPLKTPTLNENQSAYINRFKKKFPEYSTQEPVQLYGNLTHKDKSIKDKYGELGTKLDVDKSRGGNNPFLRGAFEVTGAIKGLGDAMITKGDNPPVVEDMSIMWKLKQLGATALNQVGAIGKVGAEILELPAEALDNSLSENLEAVTGFAKALPKVPGALKESFGGFMSMGTDEKLVFLRNNPEIIAETFVGTKGFNQVVKNAPSLVKLTKDIPDRITNTKPYKEAIQKGLEQSQKTYNSTKELINKDRRSLDQIAGEVVQGKVKDQESAIRTLQFIDPKSIDTYEDLYNQVNTKRTVIAEAKTKYLYDQGKEFTIDDFTKNIKSPKGTLETSVNPFSKALDDLEEAYELGGDTQDLLRVKELKTELNSGASLNGGFFDDIAKEYGAEFKDRSFSKTGDAKTSVSAQSFENTRKATKDALRPFYDDIYKDLDLAYHDVANTNRLIEKAREGVNRLSQKTRERGPVEKVFNKAVKGIDLVTLGVGRTLFTSFVQGNVGNKSFNFLGLQDELKKNIDKIQAYQDTGDIVHIQDLIDQAQELSKKGASDLSNAVIEKSLDIDKQISLTPIVRSQPKVSKQSKVEDSGLETQSEKLSEQKIKQSLEIQEAGETGAEISNSTDIIDDVETDVKKKDSKDIDINDDKQVNDIYNSYVSQNKGPTLILDTDEIKKQFSNYDPNRPQDTHKKSSDLSRKFYSKIIKDMKGDEVNLTMGGGGSGKTELLINDLQNKGAEFVFDGTGKNYNKMVGLIEEAEKVGKKVNIESVFIDYGTAKTFNSKRDRNVPEDILLGTHKGYRDTLKRLIESHPNININLKHNLGYKDKNGNIVSRDVPKEDILEFIKTRKDI